MTPYKLSVEIAKCLNFNVLKNSLWRGQKAGSEYVLYLLHAFSYEYINNKHIGDTVSFYVTWDKLTYKVDITNILANTCPFKQT